MEEFIASCGRRARRELEAAKASFDPELAEKQAKINLERKKKDELA